MRGFSFEGGRVRRTGLSSLAITSGPECGLGRGFVSVQSPTRKGQGTEIQDFVFQCGSSFLKTECPARQIGAVCALLKCVCEKCKVGCYLFGDIISRIFVLTVFSFGGCFGS